MRPHSRSGIASVAILFTASVAGHHAANATDFTAGVVLEKMRAEERYPYVAGIVEGLAYARFARDGKKTEGMACIYNWFYEKPNTLNLIYAAFGQYPDYTPGAIVSALAKKPCGE